MRAASGRLLFLLLLLPQLLSGCALINYDETEKPYMSGLVGKRFILVQDSYLIDNECTHGSWAERCLLLQVGGGMVYRADPFGSGSGLKLPVSFAEYDANPSAYADVHAFGYQKREIVSEVPKGTIITVTRVISSAWGDSGSCWTVYGVLDKQPADTSMQLGPCAFSGQGSPVWIHHAYDIGNDKPPVFDTKYLTPAP